LEKPIMHPLPVSPCSNYTGAPQVRQMPRDQRLRGAKDLDKETDTNLVSRHQVNEPESRTICQRPEKQFHIHPLSRPVHVIILPCNTFALHYMLTSDTFACRHMSAIAD